MNMKRARMILHGMLKQYDKCVDLALQIKDIDKARMYANREEEPKLHMELWVIIAKALLSGKFQITTPEALDLISRNAKISVQSLLSMFPRDKDVEEIKQYFIKCIDQYDSKINALNLRIEKNITHAH